MEIGPRIRKIRLRQTRTLEQIALACGCTRSLLSKIETGATNPPVATLTKIAGALGVPVSVLLGEGGERTTVMDPADRGGTKLVATDQGYRFQALAAARPEKVMQPYLFVAYKKDTQRDQKLSHTGEEFIHVIEGKMKYRVGTVEYTLGPGDSLYFDAEEEHGLKPVTDCVRYLGIFTDRKP